MRLVMAGLAILMMPACAVIDWQSGYDALAQRDCQTIVNADERQACLDKVQANSLERRTEQMEDEPRATEETGT